MKAITHILLYCFFLLTAIPASVMITKALTANCEMMSCSENEDGNCDKSNMECCPPGMCSNGQCCYCGFVCPVDNKNIEIRVFQTQLKNKVTSDQHFSSDFIADCWQPPELV